jgi:hypothetical protein
VILNTSDYKQKIASLLEDPAYRKLMRDPTDSIERKTTSLLKKSILPEETYKQLRPTGSRPPRLYGLPKVHKEGVPPGPYLRTGHRGPGPGRQIFRGGILKNRD